MLALIISTFACLEASAQADATITIKGQVQHGSLVQQCRPNLPLPPLSYTPIIPADQPPLNDFKKQLKRQAERKRIELMKAEDKG